MGHTASLQPCAVDGCGSPSAATHSDLCDQHRKSGYRVCGMCGTYRNDLVRIDRDTVCSGCAEDSTCDRCNSLRGDVAVVDDYGERKLCGACRVEVAA